MSDDRIEMIDKFIVSHKEAKNLLYSIYFASCFGSKSAFISMDALGFHTQEIEKWKKLKKEIIEQHKKKPMKDDDREMFGRWVLHNIEIAKWENLQEKQTMKIEIEDKKKEWKYPLLVKSVTFENNGENIVWAFRGYDNDHEIFEGVSITNREYCTYWRKNAFKPYDGKVTLSNGDE